MLPTSSSMFFPFEPCVSDTLLFEIGLNEWVRSAPSREAELRRSFAQKLTTLFHEESRALEFHDDGLTSLPSCVARLHSLEILNLNRCSSLKTLPPEIGNLSNLREINLEYCIQLDSLPQTIGLLNNLKTLTLVGCMSLESLPSQVGLLYNLETLNLHGCTRLQSLPSEIGDLQNLKTLSLFSCFALTSLPPQLVNLQKLESLKIGNCRALRSIPPELVNIRTLEPLSLGSSNGIYNAKLEEVVISDFYTSEKKEFLDTVRRFLLLLNRSYFKENIGIDRACFFTQAGAMHVRAFFISDFKDRILDKRLQNMETEWKNIQATIGWLSEDRSSQETSNLALTILDCFLSEDARIHCLRLKEEQNDRLVQKGADILLNHPPA